MATSRIFRLGVFLVFVLLLNDVNTNATTEETDGDEAVNDDEPSDPAFPLEEESDQDDTDQDYSDQNGPILPERGTEGNEEDKPGFGRRFHRPHPEAPPGHHFRRRPVEGAQDAGHDVTRFRNEIRNLKEEVRMLRQENIRLASQLNREVITPRRIRQKMKKNKHVRRAPEA